MKKSIIDFFIPVVFLILTSGCSDSPVIVSPLNPHFFQYKGETVVLISSDHHYGAIIDLDFNYETFLKYLADNKMNITRIYPGGMFEPTDKFIPGNPLGPLPGRQLLPWQRSEQPGADSRLASPGQISFKYDLEKWDPEYFIRLKSFVKLADRLNIIVEVAFFNGMYADCWPLMAMYHKNNIQNAGRYEAEDCGLFTTADIRNADVMKYQKAYIQKIATELNGFDNVIYDICDEPNLQGLPDGSIRVNNDSLIRPWIIEMKNAFLMAEQSLPKKHLIGQTVQNLSPDHSDETWCEWLPTEYVRPAEKALRLNYKANKPLVNVETNYYGISLTKDGYDINAVRIEGWWYMMSGGAGCINLNGEYYRGNENGGSDTQTRIAPQKKILMEFMQSLELEGLNAYSKFSHSATDGFCSAISESGKQYALYIFHGRYDSEWGANFLAAPGSYKDTIVLNSVPAGEYLAEWIDPVSGAVKSSESLDSDGGELKLITPEYTIDMALRIKVKE